MPEIAKCPLCGKEPDVWCRDDEWRIRITCCRHIVYSTDGWNRYAAAMELAEAIAWRDEIEPQIDWMGDRICEPKHWVALCVTLSAAKAAIIAAEKRVLEVFK